MKPMSSTQSETIALVPAQHLNWSTIPVEYPAEGIERQMVVGQSLMICRFRFKPFLVTPEHRHPHEQMSIVVQGRVRFFVEGEERIASPGDLLQFPSNWHLSRERAQAVRSALIQQGVRAERLRAEGRADAEPLVPNDSAAARSRNRRIEIELRLPRPDG